MRYATDPLPADVRAFMEGHANEGSRVAQAILTRYQSSKPAPVWQPGDVLLDLGQPFYIPEDGHPMQLTPNGSHQSWVTDKAERVVSGGRRVHPARFHDHAVFLRDLKAQLRNDMSLEALARLALAADDIDSDIMTN